MKSVNTNPTPAQREAGNFRMKHLSFQGHDITIENPKGSTRKGYNDNGNLLWKSKMLDDYGYVKRTVGHDNDQIDCFVGPDRRSTKVWVVDQMHDGGQDFDEIKVLLGYKTAGQALNAYRRSDGARYAAAHKIGGVTETDIDGLKQWLSEGGGAEPADPHRAVEKRINFAQDEYKAIAPQAFARLLVMQRDSFWRRAFRRRSRII